MAILLNAQNLSKSFGPRPLFQGVCLAIDEDDRLGMIGPNGSGKSTLLKILSGREHADTGDITRQRNLRIGYVAQADQFPDDATVLSAVVDALTQDRVKSSGSTTRANSAAALDDAERHELEVQAIISLGKAGFENMDQPVAHLSGGWRKRLSIAREMAMRPDVVLFDEPTNHLDLEGILWLEDMLEDAPFGVVVVTHDRYFLEGSTTRIVELSRAYPDGTLEVDGPYSEFLRRQDEFLTAQANQQQAINTKVRQDIAWLQRGARARRTKNKGRIVDAGQRMAELATLKERNTPQRAAGIAFADTGRQTRNLLVAEGIAKSLGDRKLFANLDITLSPGSCLGLMGPNGSGKTTLINVLTGSLPPDAGHIKAADDLRVAIFTQRRDELDKKQDLRHALCPVGDIIYHRDREIHVATWAKQFLFRSDQLNVPVGDLSGGEQARILIADIMKQPADILVLDEPTNDLDIPTLEVLEDSIRTFPGAVLLVTHDRYLLDRASTQIVGLDGEGGSKVYASYAQCIAAEERRQEELKAAQKQAVTSPKTARPTATQAAPSQAVKKLSYKEQRELDSMEANIEAAETEAAQLQSHMNDADLLADHKKLAAHCQSFETAQAEVARLYARWEELEAKRSPS